MKNSASLNRPDIGTDVSLGETRPEPLTSGPNAPSDETLELVITDILREIGVPAHIRGYAYLRRAILVSVYDINIACSVTKLLYPEVARYYGTTPSRVERAIRHAIEVAWNRVDDDIHYKYFGNTVSAVTGKPTNGEFIAMLADRLRFKENHLLQE